MILARNFEIGTSRELKIVEDPVKGSTAITVSDLLRKQKQWQNVVICFSVIAALLCDLPTQRQASAINISVVYSTDTFGDESPSWDPNGAILTAHFNAAVDIWEELIPSPGNYEFDFQWDDDISGHPGSLPNFHANRVGRNPLRHDDPKLRFPAGQPHYGAIGCLR